MTDQHQLRAARNNKRPPKKRENPDIRGASRFAHLANLGPDHVDPLATFRDRQEAKRTAAVQASWSTVMARAAAETGGSAAPNDRTAASWDAAIAKATGAPASSDHATRPAAHGFKLIPTSPRGSRLK